MKKIILAIFTVMLALSIFGCGKTQQASGGGSSSGGGGGGGNTPQTFSISGESDLLNGYVSGFSVMAADDFSVTLHDLLTGATVNANVKIEDGKYSVTGLDAAKVYEVRLRKNSDVQSNVAAKPRFSDTATVNVSENTTTFANKIIEKKDEIKDALTGANAAAGKVNELFALAKDNESKLVEYARQIKNSKQDKLTVLAWDTKNIDGSTSDWNKNYTVLFDADHPLSDTDNRLTWRGIGKAYKDCLVVKNVKVARDNDNLYFLWEQQGNGFYTDEEKKDNNNIWDNRGKNTVEYMMGIYIAGTGWDAEDETRPPSYMETPVLAEMGMSNTKIQDEVRFSAQIWRKEDPHHNIVINDKMQGKLSGDKKFLEIAVSINEIQEHLRGYLLSDYDDAYVIGIKVKGNYEWVPGPNDGEGSMIGGNYNFITNMLLVKF
ncbi:hypothetical protein NO1_0328 [Candidatus Termititenax aidoneus]|uniref:Uncharacterized protein n=1 Tax=Termititenax aidoneus TaxID=2218524 RepID=A0A388T8C2_TERA1|nr:hypothetical protein NO1_0328 [Candidatus Termititenax aidoneus]